MWRLLQEVTPETPAPATEQSAEQSGAEASQDPATEPAEATETEQEADGPPASDEGETQEETGEEQTAGDDGAAEEQEAEWRFDASDSLINSPVHCSQLSST